MWTQATKVPSWYQGPLWLLVSLDMQRRGSIGAGTGQVSLCLPPPPNSAPRTFTFSIFSSPELCIFHLPQLTPWKGADAAFTTGLQCSLSTSPPPEKELDQPRDPPSPPPPTTSAPGALSKARAGWGHRTLTCVVGGGRQALAVLLLDGGCHWAVPEEKRLRGEKSDGSRVIHTICSSPVPSWMWQQVGQI